jgi:hypothetical protein
MQTKTLITQQDFKGDLPYLSPNLKADKITPHIYNAEKAHLSFVLGNEMYNDLSNTYSKEYSILSIANGIGNLIIVQIGLAPEKPFEVGQSFEIQNLEGYLTADTTQKEVLKQVFENQKFIITEVVNTITIKFELSNFIDLTLYTITKLGIVTKHLPLNYLSLYAFIKPYLAYTTMTLYIPFGNVQNTNNGMKIQEIDTAVTPEAKLLGMQVNTMLQSANLYESQIIAFILNNRTLYPLYPHTKPIQNIANNVVFLGNRKTNNLKGYY